MNAGIILKDNVEEDTLIAFLGEELSCFSVKNNDDIVELILDKEPEVVAVDTGTEESGKEFNKREEELKEEGYSFIPVSHNPKKAKRLSALKARVFNEMGAEGPEFIRFEPAITADELAIHQDSGLESYGVDTSSIKSAEQFDAVLGAVTARFYEQNKVEDLGVIIPEPFEEDEQKT